MPWFPTTTYGYAPRNETLVKVKNGRVGDRRTQLPADIGGGDGCYLAGDGGAEDGPRFLSGLG
jgi:hypothetical protein